MLIHRPSAVFVFRERCICFQAEYLGDCYQFLFKVYQRHSLNIVQLQHLDLAKGDGGNLAEAIVCRFPPLGISANIKSKAS
jgi:hypothetical protein